MANAPRDNNRIPVELATSNADGMTPLFFRADPTTHRLKIANGVSGSNLSVNTIAKRDQNHLPVTLAVSNTDGTSPVQIYIDSAANALLTKST